MGISLGDYFTAYKKYTFNVQNPYDFYDMLTNGEQPSQDSNETGLKETKLYIPKDNDLSYDRVQRIIAHYSNGKSPLSADDYFRVSDDTGVPLDLLLAQGIAESNLGTAGRAKRTKNVGNVGNTDDGSAVYHSTWRNGLYRQAKLLRDEYKVKSKEDVQRLILSNFTRPIKGGTYASAKDYGVKVGKILNSIHTKKYYAVGEGDFDNNDSQDTTSPNTIDPNNRYKVPVEISGEGGNEMQMIFGTKEDYEAMMKRKQLAYEEEKKKLELDAKLEYLDKVQKQVDLENKRRQEATDAYIKEKETAMNTLPVLQSVSGGNGQGVNGESKYAKYLRGSGKI